VFPDTFWLKAGIAQALPAFLHLRGLFLQEAHCRKRATSHNTCCLPCCPPPGHLLPADENLGMSRADNGACGSNLVHLFYIA